MDQAVQCIIVLTPKVLGVLLLWHGLRTNKQCRRGGVPPPPPPSPKHLLAGLHDVWDARSYP